jgi:hypothetical protein
MEPVDITKPIDLNILSSSDDSKCDGIIPQGFGVNICSWCPEKCLNIYNKMYEYMIDIKPGKSIPSNLLPVGHILSDRLKVYKSEGLYNKSEGLYNKSEVTNKKSEGLYKSKSEQQSETEQHSELTGLGKWIEVANEAKIKWKENDIIIGYLEKAKNSTEIRFKLRTPSHKLKSFNDSRMIEKGVLCVTKSKAEIQELINKLDEKIPKNVKSSIVNDSLQNLCVQLQHKLIYLEIQERNKNSNIKYFYNVTF